MLKTQALEQALLMAREEFARRDRQSMALRAGVQLDQEQRLIIPFFGKTYCLPPSGRSLPVLEEILLLHYVTRAAGILPEGEWLSFKELPGGFNYREPFARRVLNPLLKFFADRPEALIEAGIRLGGQRLPMGDAAVCLLPLPRLPLAYVVWSGDEEFPPRATVLFDVTAPAYGSTEDCVWLAQLGVGYLTAALQGGGPDSVPAL
ncbi:DUF3786 domain-containing protein [Desulfothermobacter acidiphilus]|uniref:DUF3786 domain-containing protein n=1 Tax=Desulfothermobacter acidiphilus TaxID=1938353 RepID=UPI003F8929B7